MSATLVAIAGSYDPNRTAELKLKNTAGARDAAVELGRELARRKCHIVVYASDPYLFEVDVVRGYVEARKADPEPNCIHVHYSTSYGRPQFAEWAANAEMFFDMPDKNPEWEISFYRSLSEVHGVLLLGGGQSTMLAGIVGMALRKPVVAVASFGGQAEKVWAMLSPEQGLLEQRDIYRMAQEWSPGLARECVEVLLHQHRKVEEAEEARREREARREQDVQTQLARKDEDAARLLAEREAALRTEFDTRLAEALRAERESKHLVNLYSAIGILFFLISLAQLVVALDAEPVRVPIWLKIFLLLAPTTAGVCAAAFRTVYDIVVNKAATTDRRTRSVFANVMMGLVGGGITGIFYIVTQVLAIGFDKLEFSHYQNLIFFALATGFAAGFALDIVVSKLRQKAEEGVGPAFSSAS